jgi:hypothetical protein
VRLHSAIGYVIPADRLAAATFRSSLSAIANSNSLAKTEKLNDSLTESIIASSS